MKNKLLERGREIRKVSLGLHQVISSPKPVQFEGEKEHNFYLREFKHDVNATMAVFKLSPLVLPDNSVNTPGNIIENFRESYKEFKGKPSLKRVFTLFDSYINLSNNKHDFFNMDLSSYRDFIDSHYQVYV